MRERLTFTPHVVIIAMLRLPMYTAKYELRITLVHCPGNVAASYYDTLHLEGGAGMWVFVAMFMEQLRLLCQPDGRQGYIYGSPKVRQ